MMMRGEKRDSEQKFTLDGQENKNSSGRGELISKSRWEGEQLIIEGTQKVTSPRGDMEVNLREVYSLSADGKTLTILSTRTTPQGERTTKQVYNKQ